MERGIVVLMCCWEAKCGEQRSRAVVGRQAVGRREEKEGEHDEEEARQVESEQAEQLSLCWGGSGDAGAGAVPVVSTGRRHSRKYWSSEQQSTVVLDSTSLQKDATRAAFVQVRTSHTWCCTVLSQHPYTPRSAVALAWMAQCGGSRTRLSFRPAGPRRQRRAAEDVGGGRVGGDGIVLWLYGRYSGMSSRRLRLRGEARGLYCLHCM